MSKLKSSLVCIGIGFILSLLFGLFGNVRFIVVIIRAIVLGLVSGGFCFCSLWVLEKYTPELFDAHEAKVNDADMGNNVNITFDETKDDFFDNDISDLDEENDPVKMGMTSGSFAPKVEKEESVDLMDDLPNSNDFQSIGDQLQDDTTSDFISIGTEGLNKQPIPNVDSSNVETMAKAIHTILKSES